jgi:predicted CopG family antitoxin
MTKTVSLSDEAYEALARQKQEGESFSDVALRLSRASKRRSILDAAGAWKMTEADAERMIQDTYSAREKKSSRPRARFD